MTQMPKTYGVFDNHVVLKAGDYPTVAEKAYWERQYVADTLKYRWSDMPSPTLSGVLAVIGDATYYLFSVEHNKIVGEVSLEHFTGSIAQIHFSSCPDITTSHRMMLGRAINNEILNVWKNEEGGPYLTALMGLTPVPNRPATLFNRRMGYKKVAIIPNGCRYLNTVCDAILTIKEKY